MTIREQAKAMGHAVVGSLKRVRDDVFDRKGHEVHFRQYVDAEGTLYAVRGRRIREDRLYCR